MTPLARHPLEPAIGYRAARLPILLLTALLAGCGTSESDPPTSVAGAPTAPGGGVEDTPPQVALTVPVGGEVSGTVTLTADASDDAAVAGVQFILDGDVLINPEDTSAPYSVSWDSTHAVNGAHSITAKARDSAGNIGTSNPVTVTVGNTTPLPPADTTKPSATITVPANGATVSGTTTVSASASDNVGVTGVQFVLDGSRVLSDDSAAPFTYNWSTTSESNGVHTLAATARDAAGNTASKTITVTVNNPVPDTTKPSATITSPANGTTVSGTITVSASASDNVGVTGVQFKIDGANLGSEDILAPYTLSWDTKGVSDGVHALVAVVRDAAGNSETANISVTVSNNSGSSGTLGFRHVVIDSEFYGDCKSVGDIDGDGFTDIVVGGAGGLNWYRYPTWTKTRISDANDEFTTDMQVGDVDNDGDLDVIVPDGSSGNNIFWFENPRPNGNASTDAWTRRVIGSHGTYAHDIEVGDVDGDGKLDVVTRKEHTSLFLQASPGSWTRVTVSTRAGEGVALGDLDRDGDLDIVVNGEWIETPDDPHSGSWTSHTIEPDSGWLDSGVAARVVDVNVDGRDDVVLAASENTGRIAWYEAPSNPKTGTWVEHVVANNVDYVHAIKAADMDRNGTVDLVFAEMAQSNGKRVGVFLNNGAGSSWMLKLADTNGSHNIRVADIGNDGDYDIVGANWQGSPVEMWENTLDPGQGTVGLGLDSWDYIQVDNGRSKEYFGLAARDITGDGFADVASGRYFYRNPGGLMASAWPRVTFPVDADAMLMTDVNGNSRGDILATALPDVYWLEASDQSGSAWTATLIGSMPETGHQNGQGYALAQIIPGDKPEALFSAGDGIYYFAIPSNPSAGNWPRTKITPEATDEGIGTGDIDGDGQVDIAAGIGGNTVAWWKNPGNGTGAWQRFLIGTNEYYGDRFLIADINSDGKQDIVMSEENIGSSPDTSFYWFEQPANPTQANWTRHKIATQYTTNSLDAADMDGDGDTDIVAGEHRGSRKLAIWENRNNGTTWVAHVIDTGRESHLGGRVFDLDGDGDQDVLSIAYDDFPYLHLWRNGAR